jgi:sulfate adenylyltransferase subunit 1 (EFTu-like GTPase family)
VVLPSGIETRIAGIDTYEGALEEAFPPLSVTLRLEDDIDVSAWGPDLPSAQSPPGASRATKGTIMNGSPGPRQR